jgi:TetR/AcrR family transcriptional regulator, acrAB operon repressor
LRRTKEESERTRRQILGAARRVFARQGVTRTSLEEVARAAGVTRGAIYWHFADKTELFYAMREQISVPMIDRIDFVLLGPDASDPLAGIERYMRELLDVMEENRAARQTFQIMGFKCEYVGGFERELVLQRDRHAEFIGKLTQAYRRAARAGRLRHGLRPELAALDSCSFLVGMIRMWLLDTNGSLLRRQARALIAAHIAGRRRGAPARSRSATRSL